MKIYLLATLKNISQEIMIIQQHSWVGLKNPTDYKSEELQRPSNTKIYPTHT